MAEESRESYNQGRELMASGDLRGAVAALQRSVELDAHHKTLELLGECFIKLREFQSAVVPLAASTTLNRGVRASSLLAKAYFELGRIADAKEMAKLALSRDPTNELARLIEQQAATTT